MIGFRDLSTTVGMITCSLFSTALLYDSHLSTTQLQSTVSQRSIFSWDAVCARERATNLQVRIINCIVPIKTRIRIRIKNKKKLAVSVYRSTSRCRRPHEGWTSTRWTREEPWRLIKSINCQLALCTFLQQLNSEADTNQCQSTRLCFSM